MLLSIYPKAFKSNGKMKEEYRRVSDIFSGLSMNKINFGYGHSKKYWVKVGNLGKETFAQYGRFYFEENPDVLDIIKKLFPETTKAMNNAIDVISSNKYK